MSSNPFTSPNWGELFIAERPLPGIFATLDGAKRPYDWAEQKGLGVDGAALIFRGEGLVRNCTAKCLLPRDSDFDEAVAFNKFIKRKPGQKALSYAIRHPIFSVEWLNVLRIGFDVIGAPYSTGKGGWAVEYVFSEHKKQRKAQMGPAEPAKIAGPPTPKDAAEKALESLISQWEKA